MHPNIIEFLIYMGEFKQKLNICINIDVLSSDIGKYVNGSAQPQK